MLPLPRGAVWQLLFLFCAALYINGVRADGRVVCYYTNWSVYRPGTAKFNPQNINPYLCTHLIYAFGGFTKDNQMKPFDKYQDIEQGGYAKFTGLKTYNKQLKTMIAIGGWNEASSRFSPLVANPERRQKFIKNILKFLRQNHFDGIDLDWEYPAHREGGKPRDRENYAQFVQELRAEFERESEKTGRPRLLLTMAVPAGIEYIEKGYDIPKLNKYLDWFNLLTYDFHSSHEPSVNHHAPLYSLEEESEYNYDAELNIDYSIKFYLNAGADRDKLVLGIPTYGRSYTLINEESTEIGAPAEAPGEQGDATREKGYLAYYEICQNIKEDPEWTVVQPNPNAMGPYAYRRNQWVGYDDEAIVRKKAQYVVDNGLGGIMFWAIDNDDFRGICTGKPYPLIEAAKDAMLDALGLGINEVSKPSAPQKPSRSRSRENSSSTRNRITTTEHKLTYAERKGSSKRTQSTQQTTRNRQQSTTTIAPANFKLTEAEGSSLYVGGRTTTPPPPTTPDPGTDFKCEEEGFFQHPRDCKKYYWCLDSGPSGLGIVAHQFTCPSGLYFNPAADSCDFARNVPCKTKKSTTVAPITSPATTTTARPTSSYNRITAATSRPTTFFRTTPRTTTTTTTEAPEESIEYEEEDDNAPSPFAKPKGFDKDSEEDPKVIKELIELIRKVGGIEELEKHLLRKDDGTIAIKEHSSSSSSSSLTATTPSSISKSLYEKVLSKPNALNSFRNRFTSTSSFRTTKTQTKTQDSSENDEDATDSKSSGASAGFSKYSSVLRGNSRQGPQSEGLDKLSEFDGFLKEKKQYTTIQRNRGVKKTSSDDDEDEDVSSKLSAESHEEEDEIVEEVSVKSTRKPYAASTPAYSTIRRTRPTVTTEATDEEEQEEKEVNERKSYSSLNRSRVRGSTTTEVPDVTDVTAGSSRYKYLERTRPTRPTTESSNRVTDEEDIDADNESENQENTVHFKAVNIENTRETQQQQQEITTTNTQRTYASIGRRTTTTSTTATPETETTTTSAAAKTRLTTTTATPTTTSTTETPLTTTPLTILETTTPESILITTNIPITTTTNPTTTTTSTTKTTTTTLPNGEDVLENLATTTNNPNEISSDISETLDLTLKINSLLTDSSTTSTSSSSTPNPTTESGLDTNEQDIDSQLTTTEATISTTIATNSDNLAKTEDKEQEEVNVVSKQRNKTLYTTRTRTTTTTTPPTTTNTILETTTTTPSPTNAKKTLGVRRQQILLNRSSQTKSATTTSSVTTTDIPTTSTPTTESVNNDFLGTVSSPRPFGFPKRRNRPTNAAGITTTTTEDSVKSNDETLVTKQKTTKLNAAANSQTKKYQFQRRTTTTTTTTTTEKPLEVKKEVKEVTKEVAAKAQDGFTTTPPPSTTLLHIFTISDAEHTTPNPLNEGFQMVPRVIVERVKPKHKVVEINRIVEVNSKEEKLRRKSKANTIVAVEGSQTYKVESLPHVEQLGEISVVKYVHQVDGSDITIEGRSTVTDYTPTEPTVPWASQPVRHTLPDGSVEERSGKALVPEVIREAIETSTISLEGLFESARKGKVLNTVEDVAFVKQDVSSDSAKVDDLISSTESSNSYRIESTTDKASTETSTEAFNIFKAISFDVARINLEPNSKESETDIASSSSSSTSSSSSSTPIEKLFENLEYSTAAVLTTTPAPEILQTESTTVAPAEETKATTVAAALFPQYLRTPATVNNNGLTVTRRPVLSVRRRLINSSTAAPSVNSAAAALNSQQQQTTAPTLTTHLDSSSTINDEYITTTSKFKRLRTNRPPSINAAAVDITTDTNAATSFKAKKKTTETLSNDLKLASSLTSSSSADNDIAAKQTAALRRKFQARRLTTLPASNTYGDGSATEPPRTQNPLFKRRYSLTTYSPLSGKTGQQSKVTSTAVGTTTTTTAALSSSTSTLRSAIDSLTTTVYVDGLENDEDTDQVAKSSIHTSRFNQINGRLHIDDDEEEEELDAGSVGDTRHLVNTVKPVTTLSTTTRQPASRFLLQQSPQQKQQYSKYKFDDVITRRMDGTGTVLKSSTDSSNTTTTTTVSTTSGSTSTQTPAIKKRKMVIKRRPQKTTPSSEESKRRRPHKYQEPFERINSYESKAVVKTSTQPGRTYRPNLDYDYYDDEDVRLVGNKSDQQLKVILHGGGIIECLDQGNFPHPLSCRKFISCAKFETGGVVGWEYTCPKGLSYDPVGGMCNWAAGLGCKE